jgi:nitroreductase
MYTNEVVEEAIIIQMLENANWAPSNKLTCPWRFRVFTGDGLKKLASFQSSLYKEVSIQNDSFKERTFEMLQTKPIKASHIISIGMKRDEKERLPEVEEVEAVACAVQNMYLTAAAYNIGCYWGSGGITYIEKAKPFFGLGEKDKLLGFLYVGIPKKWPKGRRKSIEEKVTWVK